MSTAQPPSLISANRGAIGSFCRRWDVARFALFGSVLRSDFRDESDIDVLLTFREGVRYTLFDLACMGDELEAIFGRSVDIVDRKAVEHSPNYLRRDAILRSAEVVYAE
jgi:predicted nucleotidyltransferase